MALLTIAAIATVVGAISGYIGSGKQAKAAKSAAEREAYLENLATGAKIAELKTEERIAKGQTISGYAGGGVRADMGSPLTVLAEQAKLYARERGVVSNIGASRASAIRATGAAQASAYRYQGFQGLVQGLGTAAAYGSQAGGGASSGGAGGSG